MMTESTTSLDEDCARLGEMLCLGQPVAAAVFASAVQDPDYAHNLFVCREAPPLIDFLLKNPPLGAKTAPAQSAVHHEHSTGELVAKASKSFWEWTKSGFRIIDDATYAKRLDACRQCPNLIAPQHKVVYALVSEADKICSACGCVAAKKAKLPHETCPVADPGRPGLNNWGEPVATG
jgi:hypothetical protein